MTNLGQCVPLEDRNLEQNSPNLPIWEQCVPFTDRNSERNVPLLHQSERCVPTLQKSWSSYSQ